MIREAQEILGRRRVMVFCLETAWRTEWEDNIRKNRILLFVRKANRRIVGELHTPGDNSTSSCPERTGTSSIAGDLKYPPFVI